MTKRKNFLLTALLTIALAAVMGGGTQSDIAAQDSKPGQFVRKIKLEEQDTRATSVVLSRDGTKIAVSYYSGELLVWNTDSGKKLYELKAAAGINGSLTCSFSPDGKKIVIRETGTSEGSVPAARVWDAESGKELYQLKGHVGNIGCVDFTPDGKKIITEDSGDKDKKQDATLRIWDAASGKELHQLGHVGSIFCVGFTPDGKKIITTDSGDKDKIQDTTIQNWEKQVTTIRIWDAASGAELQKMEGHKAIYTLVISPDGKKMVTKDDGGKIDFYTKGTPTFRMWDVGSGRELYKLQSEDDPIIDFAFSPDGKTIATYNRANDIQIRDAESGKELRVLNGHTEESFNDTIEDIIFSPDGKKIATRSGYDGAIIHIWDVASGKELHRFEYRRNNTAFKNVTFSPDGKILVIGGHDYGRNVRILDVESGEELQALNMNYSAEFVFFSPDGRKLMTVGYTYGDIWGFDSIEGGKVPRPSDCTCYPKPCCSCKCKCGKWRPKCDGKCINDSPAGCECHCASPLPQPPGCTCDPKPCCSCKCTCGKWTGPKCDGKPTSCICHRTTPPPPAKECTCIPKPPCCSCKCYCGNWTGLICDKKPRSASAGGCTCHEIGAPAVTDKTRRAGERMTLTINGVEYVLRWCPPGTFTMGSPTNERGRMNNESQKQVTISNGFWMLETPVTFDMWQSITGEYPGIYNDSRGNVGDRRAKHPVNAIHWELCQAYIHALNNAGVAPADYRFSLPTEAQWEYACRAGTTTAYHFGNTPEKDKANYDGNVLDSKYLSPNTSDVRSFPSNAWGLYDMHGNVWEMCADEYTGPPVFGVFDGGTVGAINTGAKRVIRGGSYKDETSFARSASRLSRIESVTMLTTLGFRFALVKKDDVPKDQGDSETFAKIAKEWELDLIERKKEKERKALRLSEKAKRLTPNSPERVKAEQAGKEKKPGGLLVIPVPRVNGGGSHRGESGGGGGQVVEPANAGIEHFFRWCPPGKFTMGSPESEGGPEKWGEYVEKQFQVTLTQGFWMLETEVTQAMWVNMMESNPSDFKPPYHDENLERPVEKISWDDCNEFIQKMNELGIAPAGYRFSLPTEAQWEYACRAGTTTAYHFGDTLDADKANFGGHMKGTTEVGLYPPNTWGLYDMHGNVSELCLDEYAPYPSGHATDPLITGDEHLPYRAYRGGNLWRKAKDCRSAMRYGIASHSSYNELGFRLVLVSDGKGGANVGVKYPNATANGWAPEQATGPPDAYLNARGNDYHEAWASLTTDEQIEWLELTWNKPMDAVGVDVYETYNPGALVRVVAYNGDKEVARWEGVDPTPQDAPNGKGISKIRFEKSVSTNRVRLTIDSPSVPGWNEIDAVGLVDTSDAVHWATGATASSSFGKPSTPPRPLPAPVPPPLVPPAQQPTAPPVQTPPPQTEPIRFGVQAADNDGNGVIVEQVFEGYAGHKAGLKRGDVILAINGKRVATEQEYSDVVDASGKTMLLMVRKAGAGNIITIAVELPVKQ